MRSTRDPIRGLQQYIEEWGLATEQELKVRCFSVVFFLYVELMTVSFKQFDKEAKAEVDAAVEEAKASQFPESVDVFTDVYQKGYEPPYLRGREREEVHCFLVTCASL